MFFLHCDLVHPSIPNDCICMLKEVCLGGRMKRQASLQVGELEAATRAESSTWDDWGEEHHIDEMIQEAPFFCIYIFF